MTKNLLLTLDAKDDGIGILHVGPAYAEDGLLGVWCHACGYSLGRGRGWGSHIGLFIFKKKKVDQ